MEFPRFGEEPESSLNLSEDIWLLRVFSDSTEYVGVGLGVFGYSTRRRPSESTDGSLRWSSSSSGGPLAMEGSDEVLSIMRTASVKLALGLRICGWWSGLSAPPAECGLKPVVWFCSPNWVNSFNITFVGSEVLLAGISGLPPRLQWPLRVPMFRKSSLYFPHLAGQWC